jgi:putative endonuclease
MDKYSYVYMLTDRCYGTLYLGVTSDLVRRVWEHREAFVPSFTQQHGLKLLVWYEVHEDILAAITREKQLKKWRRAWKIELIQQMNPTWRDLYLEFTA